MHMESRSDKSPHSRRNNKTKGVGSEQAIQRGEKNKYMVRWSKSLGIREIPIKMIG